VDTNDDAMAKPQCQGSNLLAHMVDRPLGPSLQEDPTEGEVQAQAWAT
jgi:hypothetical protein